MYIRYNTDANAVYDLWNLREKSFVSEHDRPVSIWSTILITLLVFCIKWYRPISILYQNDTGYCCLYQVYKCYHMTQMERYDCNFALLIISEFHIYIYLTQGRYLPQPMYKTHIKQDKIGYVLNHYNLKSLKYLKI